MFDFFLSLDVYGIMSDLAKGAITSGMTWLLLWGWTLRQRHLAAAPIKILFLGPDGASFDPGVSLRRDQVNRANILGEAGAAVGGQPAGVSFPPPNKKEVDEVLAGSRNVVKLVFADMAMFLRACAAVEVQQGKRPRPQMEKKADPILVAIQALDARLGKQADSQAAEVNKVIEAVRAHTLLLDRQRGEPVDLDRLQQRNGSRPVSLTAGLRRR